MIKDVSTAYLTKQTAKRLPCNSSWKIEKLSVMKDDTETQMQTSTRLQGSFNQFQSNKLVEATLGDNFESSGLNKEYQTKTKYWFGLTKMGLFLTEISSNLEDCSQIQGSQGTKKHKQSSLLSQKSILECKSVGNCESNSE